MTPEEFGRFIGRLADYYGYRPKEQALQFYVKAFKEISFEAAMEAAEGAIRRCERFPKVAELLGEFGTADSPGTANAAAYTPADEVRTMMAPLQFLDDYGMCKAEDCPGLTDPDRCDGTLGGRVPRGCCGWDRWMVHRSIGWLKRTGRTIPPNVVHWMGEHGMLGVRSA